MKTFIIEEKFIGYADITIEAETEEEAMNLYRSGNYKDSNYIVDDMTYDLEFYEIREELDVCEEMVKDAEEALANEWNKEEAS